MSRFEDRGGELRGAGMPAAAGAAAPGPASSAARAIDGLAGAEVCAAFESVVDFCVRQGGTGGPDSEPVNPSSEAEAAPGEAIAVVEAVERLKAWLDSIQLRAIRRCAQIHRDAVAGSPLGDPEQAAQLTGMAPARLKRFSASLARNSLALDVLMATGLTEFETLRRMRFAADLGPGTATLNRALRDGAASLPQVLKIYDVTEKRSSELADEIAAKVLAPTRDGARPSAKLLASRLSRLDAATPVENAEELCAAAFAARDARVRIEPHQSAAVRIVGEMTTAVAAVERVDWLARAVRSAGLGDGRTLAQLRADVALDLLLHGWVEGPAVNPAAPAHGEAPSEPRWLRVAREESAREGFEFLDGYAVGVDVPDPQDAVVSPRPLDGELSSAPDGESPALPDWEASCVPDGDLPGGQGQEPWCPPGGELSARLEGGWPPVPAWFAQVGKPPASKVHVTVPLNTILGIAEEPGRVAGDAWVSDDSVREMATRAGSVWRRLVTDPLSGYVQNVGTKTYQPSDRIRRHVIARDVVCRAPGCGAPAAGCDLDHQLPWPAGATSVENLNAKDRRHHHLKTFGIWACAPADSDRDPQSPPGSTGGGRDSDSAQGLTWTSPTGRSYTTYPHDHRSDGSAPPDLPSTTEGAAGNRGR